MSITSWQIEGEKVEAVTSFLFLGSKIPVNGHCSHEIRRRLLLGRKVMTNLDSVLKSRHHFVNKRLYGQGYDLPSGQVQVWELDPKEGRVPKNLCLQTVMLEKTPESLLASKVIKPINLDRNQPWILIGRTDTEAEAPVFWSSNANSWLIVKVPDAGKDWRQKEKGATKNESVW